MPMIARVHAGHAPADQPAERLEARAPGRSVSPASDQRGRAVADAGRVARGHHAVLPEVGRQLGEPLGRRVRAHVLVGRPGDRSCRVFRSFSVTGTTSSANAPRVPRGLAREPGSARAKQSTAVAPDAVPLGEPFSAVSAMERPQCASRSASQSGSSSGGGGPSRRPQRAPRTTCGAWLIDSVPPASTTSRFAQQDLLGALDDGLEARSRRAG